LFGCFAKQPEEVVTNFITVLDQTDNHKAVVAIWSIAKDERQPPATTMETSSSSTTLPNESQTKTTTDTGEINITITQTFFVSLVNLIDLYFSTRENIHRLR
jgi:hypothetical protein